MDRKEPIDKKYLLGWIFLGIASLLFVIFSALIAYYYGRAKFEDSWLSLYLVSLSLLMLVPLALFVFGVVLLSLSKAKKYVVFPALGTLLLPILILGISLPTIGANYRAYSTFATEKWASADSEYRGRLIESFTEQHEVMGLSQAEVKSYLSEPDLEETIADPTSPYYQLQSFAYDLGYYQDYMDPSYYELIFSKAGTVIYEEIATS